MSEARFWAFLVTWFLSGLVVVAFAIDWMRHNYVSTSYIPGYVQWGFPLAVIVFIALTFASLMWGFQGPPLDSATLEKRYPRTERR